MLVDVLSDEEAFCGVGSSTVELHPNSSRTVGEGVAIVCGQYTGVSTCRKRVLPDLCAVHGEYNAPPFPWG